MIKGPPLGAALFACPWPTSAAASHAVLGHVVPGRAALVRPPDAGDLAATAVFCLPIREGSRPQSCPFT